MALYVAKVELMVEAHLRLLSDELLLESPKLPPLAWHGSVEVAEVSCTLPASTGCLKYFGIGAGLISAPWLAFGMMTFPYATAPFAIGIPVVAAILYFVKDKPVEIFSSSVSERQFRKLRAAHLAARPKIDGPWSVEQFTQFHFAVMDRLLEKVESFERMEKDPAVRNWYALSEDKTRELIQTYLEIWSLAALYRMEAAEFFKRYVHYELIEKFDKAVKEVLAATDKCKLSLVGLLTRPPEEK